MLGLLAGAIGGVPRIIANEALVRLGPEHKRYGEVFAGTFLTPRRTKTKPGLIFGAAGDFILSSVLGIPLVYVLSLTGKDYSLAKSWITGIIGFGAYRGLLANLGPGKTYPRDPFSNILMSASSSLWGIAAGLATNYLGDETLFAPKSRQLASQES